MPAGRPRKFETKEALQEAVDAYFAECKESEGATPPTVAGLAYHLDMSTEALRKYGETEEFVATVKRAKQRIEIALEGRLYGAAPAGVIFNLKNNFGWQDKQEYDHSHKFGDMTDEALNARIRQLTGQ